MAKDDSGPAERERVGAISPEALTAAIESMDEGVVIWDAEDRCVLRSGRLLDLLDITADDLPIGMTREAFRTARIAQRDLAPDTAARFADAIDLGRGFDFDTSRDAGRVIETRARPIPSGGWVSTLTDVTESRRNETERVTLAGRLDAILASMEQGLIVWDADGTCILRNDRAVGLLEVTEDDLAPGTPRRAFIRLLAERGNRTSRDPDEIDRDYVSGTSFGVDRTTPSGRVLACHARPLSEGGHVITMTDVTDERRASREVAELGRAAARAEEEVRAALARETRRQEETALLAQVDEWLQTCRTEAELARVLHRAMEVALPGMHGAAYLRAESGFERAIRWGGAGADPPERINADDCWALRRGRRYVYEPGQIGLPCRHYDAGGQDGDGQSFCMPVVARGRTLGIVSISQGAGPGFGEDETLSTAIRIAEHFGMAISNMRGGA